MQNQSRTHVAPVLTQPNIGQSGDLPDSQVSD